MIILILIFILFGVEVSHAQPISSPSGVIAGETDGTNRQRYREIKFTTGTTTNNADGSMTVNNSPVSATGWTDVGTSVVLTTSSDNVGIGTINPTAKLHVKGGIIADGNFSGMLLGNNMKIDGDTTRKMCFSQTLGTNNEIVCVDLDTTANTMAFSTTTGVTDFDMTGFTVTADAFVGDGSGLTGISGGASGWTDGGTNVYTATTTDNVGIGTTTPSTTLEIVKQGSQIPLMVSATATGDGNYLIVNSAGNVGIGTVLPSAILDVVSANYPVAEFTRTGSGTNSISGIVKYKALSSSTVVDGFGINFGAFIEGSGIAETQIGELAFIRDGADNSGAITFRPYASGSASERMRISSGGNVGIGTSKPLSLVAIGTGIAVADYTNVGTGDVYIKNDLEVDGTLYGNGSGLTGIAGWVDGGTNVYVSPTTDNVAIGTTTPTQKLTVVGTVSATSFVGDGSGLTGVGASGWTDAGTSIFPTATSDQVAIGTTTPVAGAALTVLGTIAGSGSGPLSITNGNVGIGTFATPTVLLHVGNTAGTPTSVGANDVYIQNDLEVDGTVYMGSCSGAGCGTSGGWTDGTNVVYTTVAADNVGIGTSTPTRLLAIHTSDPATYPSFGVCNSVGECFRVEANATNDTARVSIGSAQNVSLDFNANDVTLLKLESSGNVGIGTVGSGGAIFVSPDNTCSKCGPNNSDVWACASVACP